MKITIKDNVNFFSDRKVLTMNDIYEANKWNDHIHEMIKITNSWWPSNTFVENDKTLLKKHTENYRKLFWERITSLIFRWIACFCETFLHDDLVRWQLNIYNCRKTFIEGLLMNNLQQRDQWHYLYAL